MWYIRTFYYLSTFFINLNLFYNEITVQKNFSSTEIKSGKCKPVRRKHIYLLIISSSVHLFVYSLIIVNCSTNILSCLLCGSTVLVVMIPQLYNGHLVTGTVLGKKLHPPKNIKPRQASQGCSQVKIVCI